MTLAVSPRISTAVPAVVGADLPVPLVTGERVGYANLDHAASAPCLRQVRDAVDEFLPYYASVHRGAGYCSQVSTRVYEQARDVLRRFVGAPRTDAVVFTRNTTDALNVLANALPRNTSVVLFDTEHHAALLPWRGSRVYRIETPRTRSAAVDAVDAALASCPVGPRLLVVTGASNVTGERFPITRLAQVARANGARIALDAAQLAPHERIDIQACDIDYVVLSGHKLYAPFGAGALIGRADWLRAAPPYLLGGGATALVSRVDQRLSVSWSLGEQRHEAGSPNVVGVHALAAACTAISQHREAIEEHERELARRLRDGLATVPGLRRLAIFDGDEGTGPQATGGDDGAGPLAIDGAPDAVGVVSFALDGFDPGLLAAALSAEYGIGVRDGAFCAHIATARLLARAGAVGTKAVRVSVGLGTTGEHIDRLITALHSLVSGGTAWRYERVDGRYQPVDDPRQLPPFLLV
ncbi:MAG: aminotransferase class V-fold PLP-dependent enzyme [Sciscionella sp.]|nr:aminotransferase class V-fold PLP-dependent enzyme [Sciscionella sp.]